MCFAIHLTPSLGAYIIPCMIFDAISGISAYEFEQVSNFYHDAFLLINDCCICVLFFWASLLYPGNTSDGWSIWLRSGV